VPELEQRGHEVFGCDISHNEDETGDHFPTAGHYMRCDVGDYRHVERVVGWSKPDFVYHLAAEFGRWNGEDFYENLWRTNCIGTKHILRFAQRESFQLIHFSSSEVYGDTSGTLQEHLVPARLLNDYAMTKWVNEQQCANAGMYGSEIVVVRLFNTYGPGEHYSPYRSVNCQFLYRAMTGLPLTVYRGHKRTSTYVSDCVRTLANIIDNFKPWAVYNIAGDKEHNIEELAEAAQVAMGVSVPVFFRDLPEAMTAARKQADTSLAVQDLDHKVTVSLEEGMAKTAAWMRKEYGC